MSKYSINIYNKDNNLNYNTCIFINTFVIDKKAKVDNWGNRKRIECLFF